MRALKVQIQMSIVQHRHLWFKRGSSKTTRLVLNQIDHSWWAWSIFKTVFFVRTAATGRLKIDWPKVIWLGVCAVGFTKFPFTLRHLVVKMIQYIWLLKLALGWNNQHYTFFLGIFKDKGSFVLREHGPYQEVGCPWRIQVGEDKRMC